MVSRWLVRLGVDDACVRGAGRYVSAAGLSHPDASLFATSAWGWHSSTFIGYRAVLSLFFLSGLVASLVTAPVRYVGRPETWPIYLTNQTLVILNAHLIVSLVLAVRQYLSQRNKKGFLPSSGDGGPARWQHKLSWVLFNLSACLAPAVSAAYWTMIHDASRAIDAENLVKHALAAAAIVVDVIVTATPVRLPHAWQPAAYLALYAAFSAAYWAAGGTDDHRRPRIYAFLDYGERPASAAAHAVAMATALPAFFFMPVYTLYRLRVWAVVRRARGRRSANYKYHDGGLAV
ncbi:PREDICTED: protein rolling stone-like [Priapulus caudatus]|uniref:Protein rolling stone-like n=1 Tax=Priapulus caudatus TaxID=37621 RepID=A0ABM1F284_PRICU|nr:PREDICTED: protein rolling stone-like [Priapulus caudatus]